MNVIPHGGRQAPPITREVLPIIVDKGADDARLRTRRGLQQRDLDRELGIEGPDGHMVHELALHAEKIDEADARAGPDKGQNDAIRAHVDAVSRGDAARTEEAVDSRSDLRLGQERNEFLTLQVTDVNALLAGQPVTWRQQAD